MKKFRVHGWVSGEHYFDEIVEAENADDARGMIDVTQGYFKSRDGDWESEEIEETECNEK